nr:PxKF domain-containing protein [Petropleomorpha daqingensis]
MTGTDGIATLSNVDLGGRTAGTYPGVVSAGFAGDSSYGSQTATGALVVTKADQTITFAALPDKTIGDAPVTPSATASSGLPVSFAVTGNCSLGNDGTVSLTGVGACTVTASQAGNGDVNPAQSVSRTFGITKADQTISFAALPDKTFGDGAFTVSASASSGLPVTFAVTGACSLGSDGTVTLTGAGDCTVTASQTGNDQFNAAPVVVRTFAIAKAAQTISFAALPDKTFGDGAFTVSASASSGLPVTFAVTGACSLGSDGTVTLTGAGQCAVTASQTGNGDYNPASDVTRTFTIAKADQTITFAALPDKTFGNAPFAPSASASSGLPVTFAVTGACSLGSDGTVTLTGAGQCAVTASQTGNGDYNPASDVTRTFTIAKADQTITFAALPDKTFGNAPFAPSASASSGLPVTFAAVGACSLGSDGTVTLTGAGQCAVTASQAGNGDYNPATDVTRTFTIAKADQDPVTLSASRPSGFFGDLISLTAAGGNVGGFTYAASGSCTVDASGIVKITSGTGTCSVTATRAGDGNYNPRTSAAVIITPTPWTTLGFYQPVDMGGVLNSAKGGSTVPVKFELFAGTRELTDTAQVSFSYAKINCDGTAPTDDVETLATGNTVLRYDTTAGQFVYNWKLPTGAGCYRLTMKAADGTSKSADFRLK